MKNKIGFASHEISNMPLVTRMVRLGGAFIIIAACFPQEQPTKMVFPDTYSKVSLQNIPNVSLE